MPVPSELLRLEEKWERKTKGKGRVWANAVKGKEDVWAKAMSIETGVPEVDIKAGPMYKNYKEFAEKPEDYIENFERGIEKAVKRNKWAERFYEALTGKKP